MTVQFFNVSASLASMSRTVEDHDSKAKQEMIKAKQEKAMMYVYQFHPTAHDRHVITILRTWQARQKFRSDCNEFITQFERFKAEVSDNSCR